MKKAYIGSALRGDVEANIRKAIGYCSKAAVKGYLPLAPHTIFTQFLDDDDEYEREQGIQMGLELLRTCVDEAWFFGDITEGMQREINLARELELPVRRFTDEGKKISTIYETDQIKQMSIISGISEEQVEQYLDAQDEYYMNVGLIVDPDDESFGEMRDREDICVDCEVLTPYIMGVTGLTRDTCEKLSYADFVYLSELGLVHEAPDKIEEVWL